jgi:acylphosphatase
MNNNQSQGRCVRVRIEGLVQGVGFRAWVMHTAMAVGLDGWVRNRRDGGVEAVFAGPEEVVAEMIERCHEGPRAAEVDLVKVLDERGSVAPGFEVRPTV